MDDNETFTADMDAAGLAIEHYHGRAMWHGPAVRADDLQDALSETHVRCQWDSMGMGYIVYPLHSDRGDYFGCTIGADDESED